MMNDTYWEAGKKCRLVGWANTLNEWHNATKEE